MRNGIGTLRMSIRRAGGANTSFWVVALTPSYIGSVFASAIPARLSRQQGSAARVGPTDDAKIGPARRERRALTALAPQAGAVVA
jgi:hypothetical protein